MRKVHQESPMFSRRTSCGRKLTKNMHYAWGTLKFITCKRCAKKAVGFEAAVQRVTALRARATISGAQAALAALGLKP